MVRLAGFEPAAYGFEVRNLEFLNLLKLQYYTEIINFIYSTFLPILHTLSAFGQFSPHNPHTAVGILHVYL